MKRTQIKQILYTKQTLKGVINLNIRDIECAIVVIFYSQFDP